MRPEELSLTRDEMRALGHRVVDMIVEHLADLPQAKVTRRADRATMEAHLAEPAPREGRDPQEVLDRVREDVLGHVMHLDHPRFFGFVPSPGNFVGAMADALAAGFNVFAGTWLEAAAPAQIELVTIDWLRELCGLPDGAGGLFVSGGSMANITGLAVARHVRRSRATGREVVYASDQAHSSIERGLTVLGYPAGTLRSVASDAQRRLDPTALRRALREDRLAGRVPACIVANGGTTNTGAVDPLDDLADLCDDEGLWLHVDAAFGGAALACARGRELLAGIGRADSISLDPHKWLFQPYEIGSVLVRDGRQLEEAFRTEAEYLEDAEAAPNEVNFSDRGIQLTRSFRALKLWMTIQTFGMDAIGKAVERGLALAELAERTIAAMPDWEVVTPANMAIVTFRCAPSGLPDDATDALNGDLVEAMIEDGFAMVTSTRPDGRCVLRLCTINPRTTDDDVRQTLERLDRLCRARGASARAS